MRDLIVALFALGAIPVAFKRPMAGMLAFSLFAYMRVQDLAWGFAKGQRWSMFLAVAMVSGWFFQRDRTKPIWNFRTGLMVFMPIWTFMGLFIAVGTDAFLYPRFIEFVKIIFVGIFTTMVVQRREHLRALMWVIGISFAFFGMKNGVGAIMSGGAPIIRGPGGMLLDNNDFALALAMGIPIIVGLASSEVNNYYRRWLKLFIPFTYISISATRSRGGFLSSVLATLVLVWRSKNRFAGFAVMAAFGLIGLLALPSSMFERLQTLQNVEADGSAQGRLKAWKIAGEMIQDNPVFGVGFDQFQSNYLKYGDRAGTKSGTRVVHNAYLQIWSEAGTPVFLSYILLLVLSVLAVQRLRRKAAKVYERSWILSYCTAIEGALVTFIFGSTFLNRAQFDLIYHYFAIVIAFESIATAELESPRVAVSDGAPQSQAFVREEQFGFGRQPSARRGFRTAGNAPRQIGGGAGFASREGSL